jgi:transcriptional regulator with XRE-family HTH domain
LITAGHLTITHDSVTRMEARSLPEAIDMIMKQRRCSQNQLGRDLGKGQSWVSEMLSGKRGRDFAKVINVLARVGWEVVIRPEREKSGPVKRREFHGKVFTLAGAVAAQKVAGVSLVPTGRTPAFRNPEYVTALADHIVDVRDEQGGARLISTARSYVERLDPADIITGKDRKLQVAAARLARAQAFTLYDADHLSPAEHAAHRALTFARASGDPETQALMYITLSQIATAAGAGDRGNHYVDQGLKIPGVNDGYRAELFKRKMRALALLPRQEAPALGAYEDIRNLDEESFTFFYATGPGLSANLGYALSDLGKHRAAASALRDAANQYVEPFYYAESTAAEIVARLNGQMPEIAVDRMTTLAYILPLVNSAQLDKEIKKILAVSAQWGNVSGMREARDQLRSTVA